MQKQYGNWTVLHRAFKRHGNWYLQCQCVCGVERPVQYGNLTAGATTSCGCIRRKHGMTRSPTHVSWVAMIGRCTNPNDPAWARYGGAGITVCKRWRDFRNFLADMGERPRGKTLDRVDNRQGYYPTNCRWATPTQQNRNSRNNRLVTIGHRTKCVVEWLEEVGIPRATYYNRTLRGWSPVKAITTPMTQQVRHV